MHATSRSPSVSERSVDEYRLGASGSQLSIFLFQESIRLQIFMDTAIKRTIHLVKGRLIMIVQKAFSLKQSIGLQDEGVTDRPLPRTMKPSIREHRYLSLNGAIFGWFLVLRSCDQSFRLSFPFPW